MANVEKTQEDCSMTNKNGDQAFRAENPRERWHEMTYGGALSYLRRKYTRDLEGIDVAVSGIPFDSAVTYRSGCRLGPRAVREASVRRLSCRSKRAAQPPGSANQSSIQRGSLDPNEQW